VYDQRRSPPTANGTPVPATCQSGRMPSPNNRRGGVGLSWNPSLLSTGSIVYKFDFANSLVGAYYEAHQSYISWTSASALHLSFRAALVRTSILRRGSQPRPPPSVTPDGHYVSSTSARRLSVQGLAGDQPCYDLRSTPRATSSPCREADRWPYPSGYFDEEVCLRSVLY